MRTRCVGMTVVLSIVIVQKTSQTESNIFDTHWTEESDHVQRSEERCRGRTERRRAGVVASGSAGSVCIPGEEICVSASRPSASHLRAWFSAVPLAVLLVERRFVYRPPPDPKMQLKAYYSVY